MSKGVLSHTIPSLEAVLKTLDEILERIKAIEERLDNPEPR